MEVAQLQRLSVGSSPGREIAVLHRGVLLAKAPTQALKEQYAQPIITIVGD